MTASYLDLLNPDGSTNTEAFSAVLQTRITAEINMRLCQAAGVKMPRLGLDEVRLWRAGTAATLDQSLVGPDERKRVAEYELAELNEWVAAMKCAAGKQRAAMDVFAQAAE